MAYSHEHVLLRFLGHFGTTGVAADKWSAGIRFGLASAAPAYDPAKLQTFVNAAQAAAITFHTTAAVAAGTNCFFDQVSGAQIGVLGQYVPTSQVTTLSPYTATAGVGTPTMPWNVSCVISLRTANTRGRGSNGRVYWPMLSPSVTATTGRINSQTRVNAAKTFLDALNTAANTYSPGMRAVVASNVGGGLIVPVTGIRSDDRLDSIERRENDQPATWFTAALA